MMKVAVVVALAFALSGCVAAESTTKSDSGATAPGAPGPAAAPAQFDETTGAIAGVVLNEEGLPIPGAIVGLVEATQQATTDESGAFTFSSLQPGKYQLQAQMLGYSSVARQVEVIAGQVTQQTIQLSEIAIQSAYYEILIGKGNVQCSVRAYPGAYTGGVAAPTWTTGVAVCGVVSLPGFEEDNFQLFYTIPAGVTEVLAEMTWESTQTAGRAMGFAFEFRDFVNDAQGTFGQARGRSPQIVYANETRMKELAAYTEHDCYVDDCEVTTRAFAEAETTGLATPVPLGPYPDVPPLHGGDPYDRIDAGFTFDQRYEIYITHFHDMVKPDGYSALGDA